VPKENPLATTEHIFPPNHKTSILGIRGAGTICSFSECCLWWHEAFEREGHPISGYCVLRDKGVRS
jgi:hypothetical protein